MNYNFVKGTKRRVHTFFLAQPDWPTTEPSYFRIDLSLKIFLHCKF